MTGTNTQQWERRFRATVLAGVAANTLLALPGLLAPNVVLALLGLDEVYPALWASFACLLLLLLSLFYIPGALYVREYLWCAYLHVVSRFAGVLFFVWVVLGLAYASNFLIFAAYDFVFGALSFVFLRNALRTSSR